MACQDAEIHAPDAEGDRHGIVLLEKYAQKVMQERKKTYDLACNKMKKGEALTSLQIEAMAIVNENSKLQISDLPAEHHGHCETQTI